MEAARYAAARKAGDFDIAAVIAGEAVDLIDDVPPAAIIVERVVSEGGAPAWCSRSRAANSSARGQLNLAQLMIGWIIAGLF